MKNEFKDKIYKNISYNTNKILSLLNSGILLTSPISTMILLNICNDNMGYIMVLLKDILTTSYLILSINSEEHTKEVQKIKKIYYQILKEYNKLNKLFSFKNPVEIYTLFNKMLYDGYLSKDKIFHFGSNNIKDIKGIYPANVINGEAVCRHIATMLKDIYYSYGIEGNTLIVYKSNFEINTEIEADYMVDLLKIINDEHEKTNIPIDDLIYKYEEEINKYFKYIIPKEDKKVKKTGNHLITTAVYQGNTYYLDPTQSTIYKPSKIDSNLLLDELGIRDTAILPNRNKKVLHTLPTSSILFSEIHRYIDNTTQIYNQNKDIIERFYIENKESYDCISEELSKIRIKNKK